MLWPEFLQEGGELLHKLPSKYEEGMKFDYVNVSIQYYVSIDEENYTLLKGQKIVNDESVYTFTFPDKMEYTGNDKISFTTTQKFLTKEGNKEVIIKAIFKRRG